MPETLDAILTAALWGCGGALLGWLLAWPVRTRTTVGGYVSIVAVATLATLGAVIGNIRAMLIAMGGEVIVISTALVAGALASAAALTLARTLRRDRELLHRDLVAIGSGRLPETSDNESSGELAGLREDLHRMANSLAAARERERAMERSRRELVGWISHDLRTPLAGIRAMAEALEDDVAQSPETYRRQITVEVDRVVAMVDDLFQLSRLHTGSVAHRQERLSLSDLVSDTLAGLTPVARLNGVTLEGSAATVADVVGDGAQLNRALTNLVYNAIRHTSRPGTVRIEVQRIDGAVGVEVQDECGGIDDADLTRIFEVGYRGETSRPSSDGMGSGTGLGLAIAREIVQAHHGELEARNRGAGCVFTMRLPAAEEAA